MSVSEISIVLMAFVAIVALIVIANAQHTRKGELVEIAAMFQGALEGVVRRADAALVAYGQQLEPVHAVLEVGETLVDEESDWPVQALAKAFNVEPGAVVAAFRPLFEHAMKLTDGQPPTDTVK